MCILTNVCKWIGDILRTQTIGFYHSQFHWNLWLVIRYLAACFRIKITSNVNFNLRWKTQVRLRISSRKNFNLRRLIFFFNCITLFCGLYDFKLKYNNKIIFKKLWKITIKLNACYVISFVAIIKSQFYPKRTIYN